MNKAITLPKKPQEVAGQVSKAPEFMLTPSLISQFQQYEAYLKNPSGDVRMADPREKSFNGVSGFDLYAAWQSENYVSGNENDGIRNTFNLPAPSPVSNVSAQARAFSSASSLSANDFLSGTVPTVAEIAPTPVVASQPISLFNSQPTAVQPEPVAETPNPVPGVNYISPKDEQKKQQFVSTYKDRASSFKRRMF